MNNANIEKKNMLWKKKNKITLENMQFILIRPYKKKLSKKNYHETARLEYMTSRVKDRQTI